MALENVQDIYPLSPTQAGMVFHTIAETGTGVYIGQVCCTLQGALDKQRLEHTWVQLIQRHDALRTAFVWEDLDEPLQVVREHVSLTWTHLDLCDRAPEVQAEDFEQWRKDDRVTDFDLAEAPLMRLTLIALGADRHHLVWTSHHALTDGWSVKVLLDEMMVIYRDRSDNPGAGLTQALPYSHYIAWLRSQDLGAAEIFWHKRLAGFHSPIALKTGTPGASPVSGVTHAELSSLLEPRLSSAARQLARDHQVSLYTVMQAAWGILLHRYSDETDIVFGVAASGRPPQLPGIEEAVGLFINTLPARHDFQVERSVSTWLKQLQKESIDFAAYEYTPLSRINEWSEVPPGTALFDTILVFSSYPERSPASPEHDGLTVEDCETSDQSNYGLALLIEPGDRIAFKLVFDTRRYSAPTADRILCDLHSVLDALVSRPNGSIAEIMLPGETERVRMLEDWCVSAQIPDVPETVLSDISAQVRRNPDSPAVTIGPTTLSYVQLEAKSDRLAKHLIAEGVQPGQFVGISLDPGIELITAIVAVLKAGAAYVPIDPEYPRERVRFMVEDASMALVILGADQRELFGTLDVASLRLDAGADGPPDPIRLPAITPDMPAYVIYTSGSTGRPKGVVVTHANLAHSTHARLEYYQRTPKAFLLLSSFSFDSSVAGIFWTLATGGNLLLAARRSEQDIEQLSLTIERNRVSHTLCLPSLYRVLLQSAPKQALRSLDTVILAGEVLTTDLVRAHRLAMPDTALFNEYGPTEATVWCTVFDTSELRGETSVPIGRPVPGARLYLLDSKGRLVPPGVAGEIHIAGGGVAAGYLGQAEATAKKFRPDPFRGDSDARMYRTGDLGRFLANGELAFVGRSDDQVKLRGHRIEVAEIESVLQGHPDVESAAVILKQTDQGTDLQSEVHTPATEIALRLRALGEGVADALLSEIEAMNDEDVTALLRSGSRNELRGAVSTQEPG